MKLTLALALMVACLFSSQTAPAAVVTVDVTIKAVNSQARGITVFYKTELGEKNIELDVSRKAEVTVNEKEVTLDSLGPGLKAKVSYDKELAIVTKIEATGVVVKRKPPELVEVSELNPGMYPWLSEDGLTVFWERNFAIWTAHRANVESYFSEKKELFPGRQPTLTADGLEMIFLGTGRTGGRGERFSVAKRENVQQPFNRAREIAELADEEGSRNMSLSPDGLSVYFNSSGGGGDLVVSVRKTKDSPWSKPRIVPIAKGFSLPPLGWPYVCNDLLTLYCCNQEEGYLKRNSGNLWVLSRSSRAQPFTKPILIEVEGLPKLVGRSPRFVPGTNELFFTKMMLQHGKPQPAGIWVIRNFAPPGAAEAK